MVHDPVAQSIRNEQRADAAPTAEEHRRNHRQSLANRGCIACDCDDPDELNQVRYETFHGCANDQHPSDPWETVVFCDEHLRSPAELERAHLIQSARTAPGSRWLVIYDCGHTETVEQPTEAEFEKTHPHAVPYAPSVAIVHRGRGNCDEPIAEIVDLQQ